MGALYGSNLRLLKVNSLNILKMTKVLANSNGIQTKANSRGIYLNPIVG